MLKCILSSKYIISGEYVNVAVALLLYCDKLPMVEGTVGSGGFLSLIIWLHSNFFLMTSLSGSTVNPKLRFWMLYSWPQ
jgi:hypothetical protein